MKTGYRWNIARDDLRSCSGDRPSVVYSFAPGRVSDIDTNWAGSGQIVLRLLPEVHLKSRQELELQCCSEDYSHPLVHSRTVRSIPSTPGSGASC